MLPIDVQFDVRTPDIVASTSHGYTKFFTEDYIGHINC